MGPTDLPVQGLSRYCAVSPSATVNGFLSKLYDTTDVEKRRHDIQLLTLYRAWLRMLIIRADIPGYFWSDTDAFVNTWILVQAIRCVCSENTALCAVLERIAVRRTIALAPPMEVAQEDKILILERLRKQFPFTSYDRLDDEVLTHLHEPFGSGLVCNRLFDEVVASMSNAELHTLVQYANVDTSQSSVVNVDWNHILAGVAPLPSPGYSLLYHAYASASCRSKPTIERLFDIFMFSPMVQVVVSQAQQQV